MRLAKARRHIETHAAEMTAKERCKANHKPFLYVERLKENLLHQLERFPKRLEDFDFGFGSIHARDSEWVLAARSIPKTRQETKVGRVGPDTSGHAGWVRGGAHGVTRPTDCFVTRAPHVQRNEKREART